MAIKTAFKNLSGTIAKHVRTMKNQVSATSIFKKNMVQKAGSTLSESMATSTTPFHEKAWNASKTMFNRGSNLRKAIVSSRWQNRKFMRSSPVKAVRGSVSNARYFRYSRAYRAAKTLSQNKVARTVGKYSMGGALVVGAVGMFSMGVAKGMMNEARENVFDRYMHDQRMSRNMLHNSRVGLTSGTNSMLGYGSTQGLSNSLSKTRHG